MKKFLLGVIFAQIILVTYLRNSQDEKLDFRCKVACMVSKPTWRKPVVNGRDWKIKSILLTNRKAQGYSRTPLRQLVSHAVAPQGENREITLKVSALLFSSRF